MLKKLTGRDDHAAAAKRLHDFVTAETARLDQLEAEAREAVAAVRATEYWRAVRAAEDAVEALTAARESYVSKLPDYETAVFRCSPARPLVEQITKIALSRASALRDAWDSQPRRFLSDAELTQLREQCDVRDRQLASWTEVYQRAPGVLSSPTPFRCLSDLVAKHVGVLPELGHFAIDIPTYETELANAD